MLTIRRFKTKDWLWRFFPLDSWDFFFWHLKKKWKKLPALWLNAHDQALWVEDPVEYILVIMICDVLFGVVSRWCFVWCVWLDTVMCRMWLGDMCDVTRLCVWHFVWKTLSSPFWYVWLVCVCDVAYAYVWCDSFICVTWLVGVCVTWLVYMCDTLYGRLCHVHSGTYDLCVCVTLLIHTCDVTRSYVWRDWLICVTCLV